MNFGYNEMLRTVENFLLYQVVCNNQWINNL